MQSPGVPYPHPLFDLAIVQHRNEYFKRYYIYATLLVLLMWGLLPIYWASLAYAPSHEHNLRAWVIGRDESTIATGIVTAVQQTLVCSDSSPTLGWLIVNGGDPNTRSNDKVITAVLHEQVWAAIISGCSLFYKARIVSSQMYMVYQKATANPLSVVSGGPGNLNMRTISAYYDEACNQ